MSDLIDRQELLRQIDIDAGDEPGYYGDTWKFIDTIKNMPSATDISVGDKFGTNLAEVGTDLISRQAAINLLSQYPFEDVINCISILEEMPSAQPERKKGKWIEYEQEFMLEGHTETVQKTVRECSICTAKIAGMVGIMNFCPHCGAEMEIDEQSTIQPVATDINVGNKI